MFCVQKRLSIVLGNKALRVPPRSKSLLVSSTSSFSTLPRNGEQITLWHSPDARSLRCVWTLEELGVTDYSLITMPFPPRFFHRDFLKINVLGTIPFMKDGDATMTESCGSEYCLLVCINGSHTLSSLVRHMIRMFSFI